MSFIVLAIFFWVFVSILRAMARAQKHSPPPPLPGDPWDPFRVPPEHVLHFGEAPPAVPARVATEESSSEVIGDETAADTELALPAAEVVSLERVDARRSSAPRPLPAQAVTLEHEVDWEAEHEIFHKRYVDARPAAAHTAHGLMDELRDPDGARRAVLMAEILGPPLSLRGRK